MMKSRRFAVSSFMAMASAVSVQANSSSQYLLLTIEKDSYASSSSSSGNTNNDVLQKYKILVDSNFNSQFKFQPTASSSGSALFCVMSDAASSSPGMLMSTSPSVSFTQWFQPKGGKVSTWMWGEGAETLAGKVVEAENAKAQINLNFPSWATIDSSEMIGFTGGDENAIVGVNISMSAKSVAAGDSSLSGALVMPVKAADGSVVAAGDPQTAVTLHASCSFQNN